MSEEHDPLCSEGVYAGDQRMPCDCRRSQPMSHPTPDAIAAAVAELSQARQMFEDVLAGRAPKLAGDRAHFIASAMHQAERLLLALAAAHVPERCSGSTCNPHTAACGARFCTYEEMAGHVCEPEPPR